MGPHLKKNYGSYTLYLLFIIDHCSVGEEVYCVLPYYALKFNVCIRLTVALCCLVHVHLGGTDRYLTGCQQQGFTLRGCALIEIDS